MVHVSHMVDLNQNVVTVKIDYVNSIKCLGLIYDSHLTWKDHIHYISSKIAKNTGILARIRYFIDKETALTIYNSLIHSYINYCSGIWATNYRLLVAMTRSLKSKKRPSELSTIRK